MDSDSNKRNPSDLLSLPPVDLKTRKENDIVKVFDIVRNKYVALTPEEFVRQHFVHWLVNTYHYPLSLLMNEVTINLNGLSRRCDTVLFRADGRPRVIVEYKAPTVPITQKTFDQIARYNLVLEADYLIVSNGVNHYCCSIDTANKTYNFIPVIPDYLDMVNSPNSDNFNYN